MKCIWDLSICFNKQIRISLARLLVDIKFVTKFTVEVYNIFSWYFPTTTQSASQYYTRQHIKSYCYSLLCLKSRFKYKWMWRLHLWTCSIVTTELSIFSRYRADLIELGIKLLTLRTLQSVQAARTHGTGGWVDLQIRSGCFEGQTHVLHLQGIKPRCLGCPAHDPVTALAADKQ